jgi:hypothetical protein
VPSKTKKKKLKKGEFFSSYNCPKDESLEEKLELRKSISNTHQLQKIELEKALLSPKESLK